MQPSKNSLTGNLSQSGAGKAEGGNRKVGHMYLSETEARALPGAAYDAILHLGFNKPIPNASLASHVDAEMKKAVAALKLPKLAELSREARSLLLPLGTLCRAMTTNVFGSAGAFVESTMGEIEGMLRPASVCARAGARVITGLIEGLTIPRELTSTTFSWLAEIESITESDGTAGQLNLVPHRLGGATSISTQLNVQAGPLFIEFLAESLARGIAVGIDAAALAGTGVIGSPLGLWYAPNVNTVTFGGAATWAKAVNMTKMISAQDGNDEKISFVGNPDTKEKWQNTARVTGSGRQLWEDDNTVAGKPAYVTTNVPSGGIAAGDFTSMVIATFGEDTPIQLIVDPFRQAFAGRIGFVATVFADVGILRPQCFTRNSDSAIQ